MGKGYTVESKMIPAAGREMELLILRSTKNAKPWEKTPGILWIHGAGEEVWCGGGHAGVPAGREATAGVCVPGGSL